MLLEADDVTMAFGSFRAVDGKGREPGNQNHSEGARNRGGGNDDGCSSNLWARSRSYLISHAITLRLRFIISLMRLALRGNFDRKFGLPVSRGALLHHHRLG